MRNSNIRLLQAIMFWHGLSGNNGKLYYNYTISSNGNELVSKIALILKIIYASLKSVCQSTHFKLDDVIHFLKMPLNTF